MMFLDLRFDEWIQSAVNLGHCCFLPATLIAQRASGILLFRANRLLVLAKLGDACRAMHMHLPAKASRHTQRLDFHENKGGTFVGSGQASGAHQIIGRGEKPRSAAKIQYKRNVPMNQKPKAT